MSQSKFKVTFTTAFVFSAIAVTLGINYWGFQENKKDHVALNQLVKDIQGGTLNLSYDISRLSRHPLIDNKDNSRYELSGVRIDLCDKLRESHKLDCSDSILKVNY